MQLEILAPASLIVVLALGIAGAEAMGGCGHKVTPDKSPYAILEPQTVPRAARHGAEPVVTQTSLSGSSGEM